MPPIAPLLRHDIWEQIVAERSTAAHDTNCKPTDRFVSIPNMAPTPKWTFSGSDFRKSEFYKAALRYRPSPAH